METDHLMRSRLSGVLLVWFVVVFCVGAGLPLSSASAEDGKIHEVNRSVKVQGTLHIENAVVNQGENEGGKSGDDLPKLLVLMLDKPIKVKSVDQEVSRIQLSSGKVKDEEAAQLERKHWEELAKTGKHVKIEGRLWPAETVHHRTPVLIDVSKLESHDEKTPHK